MKRLHSIILSFLTIVPLLQGMHHNHQPSLFDHVNEVEKFSHNYRNKLAHDSYKAASNAGMTCCIISPLASTILAGAAIAMYTKNPECCNSYGAENCIATSCLPVACRCMSFGTTLCCGLVVIDYIDKLDQHFTKQNKSFFTVRQD